jgi:hemoglobin
MTHLELPLAPDHFELWLTFFAETANEVFPRISPPAIAKSQRIARNFKNRIAFQRTGSHPHPAAK